MTEQISSQYEPSRAGQLTTSDGASNLMFLLAGAAIGAATALLFAPKAGVELRGNIADVTRRGYDGAVDLTGRVRDETSHLYDRVREKGSDLLSKPAETLASVQDAVVEAAGQLDEKADDVLTLADEQSRGTGQSGRKSTNIV